ncbi:unnamed protein product [Sphagnum tenellum]
MRLEVRLRLLRAAIAFYRFLDIKNLVVDDIRLTGSNAAYNYTKMSDLDVHLIVDFKTTPCPALAENVFTTKKALWSETYDISIRGHQIELYVEDKSKPAESNGLYSILRGEWLKTPSAVPPKKNDSAVVAKTKSFMNAIDNLLNTTPSGNQIDTLFNGLRTMRANGLEVGGEESVENLTYKALRALGYLDKLYDARRAAIAADLSL